MLLIMGTVRIDPAKLAEARPAIETVITATRAEDGCISYAFAQDLLDRGLIRISEAWRDGDALKAHAASPHMAVWREAYASFGITERNLKVHQADEGRAL